MLVMYAASATDDPRRKVMADTPQQAEQWCRARYGSCAGVERVEVDKKREERNRDPIDVGSLSSGDVVYSRWDGDDVPFYFMYECCNGQVALDGPEGIAFFWPSDIYRGGER